MPRTGVHLGLDGRSRWGNLGLLPEAFLWIGANHLTSDKGIWSVDRMLGPSILLMEVEDQ